MSNAMRYMDGVIRDVLEKLENEINEAEALRDAWAKVEFPTKKDGTEFQAFAKNFTNCTVNTKSYAIYQFEKEIKVWNRTRDGHAVYDSIDTYESLNQYIAHPRADEHPERVVKPSQYLVPFYMKSVEDCRADIIQRTEYWAKVANSKAEMLITVEKELRDLMGNFNDLLTAFEEKNGEKMASLAKSAIRDHYYMFG